MGIADKLGHALLMAVGMAWQTGWTLVFGFAVSAVLQAVVSTTQMRKALGRGGPKEIADRVFLSSPAVSARIARLEKDGLLTGYSARVDAARLGYLVKAFINLDMDPQRKPEFYPYIESCPNVVECCCVTGDYIMLIEVLFATTQELDAFINRLQQFGRTRTQIVFSTSVEHRGVPVDSEPDV